MSGFPGISLRCSRKRYPRRWRRDRTAISGFVFLDFTARIVSERRESGVFIALLLHGGGASKPFVSALSEPFEPLCLRQQYAAQASLNLLFGLLFSSTHPGGTRSGQIGEEAARKHCCIPEGR